MVYYGKRYMMDILDELAQAYSFLRDPLLGKAIDEIADQRRTIESMRKDLHDLRHENQILIEVNRDLYMQLDYYPK